MTMDDMIVIIGGSVALLALFIGAQLIYHYVDVLAIVRRYVVINLVDVEPQRNEDPEFPPATTTPQPATTALQSDATNSNELLLGQARALAAMVKANKIGETEGIKIVFGVSPSSTNPRYQAARAALKAELERLNDPYPYMTPEQKRAREALGLSKP